MAAGTKKRRKTIFQVVVLGYLFWFKRVKESLTLTEQVSRELFSAVCLDFRTKLKLMKVSCVPFHQLDQPLLVRKEEKLEVKESEKKICIAFSNCWQMRRKSIMSRWCRFAKRYVHLLRSVGLRNFFVMSLLLFWKYVVTFANLHLFELLLHSYK